MRLIKLKIQNFKRFENSTVNLDGDLIAIVGPNEAGKSSLLDAVRHLDSDDPIPEGAVTRGVQAKPGDTFVSGVFLLEDSDLQNVTLSHGTRTPRWMELNKKGDGTFNIELRPTPERRLDGRMSLAQVLNQIARTKHADALAKSFASAGHENLMSELTEFANSDAQSLGHDGVTVMRQALELLPKSAGGLIDRLSKRLAAAVTAEELPHPEVSAREHLWDIRPDIVVFSDQERTLDSTYQITPELATNPPAALGNLADLASLDLKRLANGVARSDAAEIETILDDANRRLREVFNQAWKQSELTVRLRVDAQTLSILVSNPVSGFSTIAERSDGLRAFVALIGFVARRPSGRDLILLIDEAEAHLHYDAQADLVRMLSRQESASQVIYTTHSAGCLPQDLGTGIRVVVPHASLQRSSVRNSFWTEGPGLTPLMLGMGASVLAFTPARNAVIAEGGADAVLLPTLLREVTGKRDLDFQIVPGLAELSSDGLKGLDAEAGRVAYLVDGDQAGARLSGMLSKAGIDEARIAIVGDEFSAGLVPEDLVSRKAYLAAVNEELRRSHGEGLQIVDIDLSDQGRPTALEVWCKSKGVPAPGRVAIALRVIERRRDMKLVMSGHRVTLRKLHRKLEVALGLT